MSPNLKKNIFSLPLPHYSSGNSIICGGDLVLCLVYTVSIRLYFTCLDPWSNRSQHKTNRALVHSNSCMILLQLNDNITLLVNSVSQAWPWHQNLFQFAATFLTFWQHIKSSESTSNKNNSNFGTINKLQNGYHGQIELSFTSSNPVHQIAENCF